MRPPAMSSRVLPPAWQLLVVFLAFVPAGRAVVANCTSGWEWVRLFHSFGFDVVLHPKLIDILLTHHFLPSMFIFRHLFRM